MFRTFATSSRHGNVPLGEEYFGLTKSEPLCCRCWYHPSWCIMGKPESRISSHHVGSVSATSQLIQQIGFHLPVRSYTFHTRQKNTSSERTYLSTRLFLFFFTFPSPFSVMENRPVKHWHSRHVSRQPCDLRPGLLPRPSPPLPSLNLFPTSDNSNVPF